MTVGPRPRVLLATGRADPGGGPEHIRQLVAAQRADFHVAAPRQEPYFAIYQDLLGTNRVHEIPSRSLAPSAWRAAGRAIGKATPDLIHTHGPSAGALFRPLAVVTRTPTIHTYHGVHVGEYSSAARFLYVGVERLLSAADQAQISVSVDELDQLTELRLGRRAVVIRNGVEIPFPPERGAHRGPIRFVTAARQTFQKDPLGLIAAFGSLDPGQVHLTIFGDGELSAEVMEAAGCHTNIAFVGHLDRPAEKYAGFDAYISNSRWEGLPLSVLEAMAMALPAVLSRVPGHMDLASRAGNGVVLFEQSSAPDLSAAVRRLTDLGVRRAGTEARQAIAADFDAEAMAVETAALYRRVRDRLASP